MAEVERKFLVGAVPAGLGPGAALRQAYLAVDGDVEVRVRDEDGAFTLTVKGGSGLERTEVEAELDAERFAELWPLGEGRRIEKARHRVALDDAGGPGLVAEVDVYAGALAGLVVVEVEFPDRAAADAFVAPAWFGEELTGRPGWSNAALARHGRPAG